MDASDEVPVLQARVKDLELEVSSLKAKLRSTEQQLADALGKTETDKFTVVASYLPSGATSGETKPSVAAQRANFKKFGEMTLKMRARRQEKTSAVRNQIVHWVNRIMVPEPPLNPDDFMERLASGVMLCNLVLTISETAVDTLGRFHPNAKGYSIYAHENTQAFINTCVGWGVNPHECFSPHDLLSNNIDNRDERGVVFTILALSRVVFHKFGIEPPFIIKAELLIDSLNDESKSSNANTPTHADGTDVIEVIDANKVDSTGLSEADNIKIHDALQAYCVLNYLTPPEPTKRRGEFHFVDGTTAHVRLFECSVTDTLGDDSGLSRDGDSVLDGVSKGDITLLVRYDNAWEDVGTFLQDHQNKDCKKGKVSKLAQNPFVAKSADLKKEQVSVEVVSPDDESEDVTSVTTTVTTTVQEVDSDGNVINININIDSNTFTDDDIAAAAAAKAISDADAEEAAAAAAALAALAAADIEAEAEAVAKALAEAEAEAAAAAGLDADGKPINANAASKLADSLPEVGLGLGLSGSALNSVIDVEEHKKFKNMTTSEMSCMTETEKKRFAEYTARQEFFYLTALAVKMTHELRDDVQVISNEELWNNSIQYNIPFYKFHSFIQHEITKSYLAQESQERLDFVSSPFNLRKHRESMVLNIQQRQRNRNQSIFDLN